MVSLRCMEDMVKVRGIRVLSGEGIMCDKYMVKREEKMKVTFRMGVNET